MQERIGIFKIPMKDNNPLTRMENKDSSKFPKFYRSTIEKIWKNFDKATMSEEEFNKKYPPQILP